MNTENCQCPECGSSNFSKWELPHWVMLFWYLTPFVVVNELIFGQRVAKTILVCKDCEKPFPERIFIPCPSCQTLHDTRLISHKNQFGNWRGIRCPTCQEEIPTLRNVFAKGILWLTYPLWVLPYRRFAKDKPLPLLYDFVDGKPPQIKKLSWKTWAASGLSFGLLTWLFQAYSDSREDFVSYGEALRINWLSILISGCFFGLFMWLFLGFVFQKPKTRKISFYTKISLMLIGIVAFGFLIRWQKNKSDSQYDELELQADVSQMIQERQDHFGYKVISGSLPPWLNQYASKETLPEIAKHFEQELSLNADFDAESGTWIAYQSMDKLDGFTRIQEAVLVSWDKGQVTEVYPIPELFAAFELDDHIFFCWDDRKVSKQEPEKELPVFVRNAQNETPFRMIALPKQQLGESWYGQRDYGDFLMAAHDFSGLEGFSSEGVVYWDFELERELSQQLGHHRGFRFFSIERWQKQREKLQPKQEEVSFEGFIDYSAPISTENINNLGEPIKVILTESRIPQPVFKKSESSDKETAPKKANLNQE